MSITREQKKDMLRRQIAGLNDTSVDCMMATYELQHLDLEDALAASVAKLDRLRAELSELRRDRERMKEFNVALMVRLETSNRLLSNMLDVAENGDETGYVTDCGFVDLDKLHAEVRAAIGSAGGETPAPLPECVQPGKETNQ